MEIATTMTAEVILRVRLPFSTDSGGADREGVAEPERLLNDGRPFRAATAKSAVHAVDVSRTRMTANLAKALLHHLPYRSMSVPKLSPEWGAI
jgi:hypothetical protein